MNVYMVKQKKHGPCNNIFLKKSYRQQFLSKRLISEHFCGHYQRKYQAYHFLYYILYKMTQGTSTRVLFDFILVFRCIGDPSVFRSSWTALILDFKHVICTLVGRSASCRRSWVNYHKLGRIEHLFDRICFRLR